MVDVDEAIADFVGSTDQGRDDRLTRAGVAGLRKVLAQLTDQPPPEIVGVPNTRYAGEQLDAALRVLAVRYPDTFLELLASVPLPPGNHNRETLAIVLGFVPGQRASQLLTELARDEHWRTRLHAVEALISHGDSLSTTLLEEATNDTNESVRRAAEAALRSR